MRRIFAIGILALCSSLSQAPVEAAEGRIHDRTAPTLDENRVSRYTRAEKPEAPDSKTRASGAAKTHSNTKLATAREKRPLTQSMSMHASHIYIYDAGSALLADADGDGYHREFRIRFDADSVIGDVLVFARLYLRRVGDADWLLYHTTDDFWIYGQSGSDDYFVTTTLDDGFPTGEYDVLIDLYEVGFPGIVATFGPFESGALADLPLEEAGLDVPIELPGLRDRRSDDDAPDHRPRRRRPLLSLRDRVRSRRRLQRRDGLREHLGSRTRRRLDRGAHVRGFLRRRKRIRGCLPPRNRMAERLSDVVLRCADRSLRCRDGIARRDGGK